MRRACNEKAGGRGLSRKRSFEKRTTTTAMECEPRVDLFKVKLVLGFALFVDTFGIGFSVP